MKRRASMSLRAARPAIYAPAVVGSDIEPIKMNTLRQLVRVEFRRDIRINGR
jgi:hypothetical protein